MSDFAAYDRGLPCKNPSCKSHGKPHPNCQCYGGNLTMAEGGEVPHFCSEDRKHDSSCEYFADGGEAAPLDYDSLKADEPAINPPQEAPLSFDSLKADEPAPDLTDFDSLKDDHESLGQQALTGLEGAARGYTGPISDLAEDALSKLGVPGISKEERKARADINPTIAGLSEAGGLTAGLLTGTGEAGLALKLGEHLGAGSRLISGAISSGIIQAGSEIDKSLLGIGDPNESVASHLANVGGAALLGGAGGAAASGFEKLKMGSRITGFLGGLAAATDPKVEAQALGLLSSGESSIGKTDTILKAFEKGKKAAALLSAPVIGTTIGGYEGYKHDGFMGALKGAVLGGIAGEGANKLAPSIINMMSKTPMLMKDNLGSIARDVLDHATSVNSGAAKINRVVDALFKGSTLHLFNEDRIKKLSDKLHAYVGDNGLNNSIYDEMFNQNQGIDQNYAKGGEVKAEPLPKSEPSPLSPVNQGVAHVYPEQNILLSASKARVANYLNSLRPLPHQQKLAFDEAPDDHEQKQTYKRALSLAAEPLSIVHEISKGTVTGEHLKHFKSMYPEIDDVLRRKMTEKITHAQLKGEKPSSHIREGLSMLFGTPLSSEMKPANIQAAQAVFMAQKAQAQSAPSGKPASNKTSLSKMDDSMRTGSESLVNRQQRDH